MIPSTQSKRYLPEIEHASGQYVWDREGNEYLDFTGSNLTVVLGYRSIDPIIPNFPGVSYLERELSDKLTDMTPYNYFRYFKNGHNAVDCAIRLARHVLGVKRPITGFCGYHGTSDIYMSTTKDHKGIDPQPSIKVPEDGDCDILVYESRNGGKVKDVECKISICDTLKEGIRALYNLYDSDFVLYGKSIGNGSPIAILTGKDEQMKRLGEIYYSTTFGGENIGLNETLRTIEEYERGKKQHEELLNYAKKLPLWRSFTEKEIKHFLSRGIINTGYWQIMTCHTKENIDKLEDAYQCLPKE